jgi:hypothetical protein
LLTGYLLDQVVVLVIAINANNLVIGREIVLVSVQHLRISICSAQLLDQVVVLVIAINANNLVIGQEIVLVMVQHLNLM